MKKTDPNSSFEDKLTYIYGPLIGAKIAKLDKRRIKVEMEQLVKRTVAVFENDKPKERAITLGRILFMGWVDRLSNAEIFEMMSDSMRMRNIIAKSANPIAQIVHGLMLTH